MSRTVDVCLIVVIENGFPTPQKDNNCRLVKSESKELSYPSATAPFFPVGYLKRVSVVTAALVNFSFIAALIDLLSGCWLGILCVVSSAPP